MPATSKLTTGAGAGAGGAACAGVELDPPPPPQPIKTADAADKIAALDVVFKSVLKVIKLAPLKS